MSAEIYEFDRGICGFSELYGDCWHGLFENQPGPIDPVRAQEILEYTVIKEPLYRKTGELVKKAYTLVRTDKNIVLYPCVGERYTVVQNLELLSFIENSLLSKYEGISIGSVGTLKNGQIAYVDLKLADWAVKGDNSKSIGWLMYSNPFGGLSLLTCAHLQRVVCNNTYRLATAQGAANETLRKFVHNPGVVTEVSNYIIELALLLGNLKETKEQLDVMATVQMNEEAVTKYTGTLFAPTPDSKGSIAICKNQVDKVVEIFDTAEDLKGPIWHTKYAMFQATTQWVDHVKTVKKGQTAGDAWFDGLMPGGLRDGIKQEAFALLSV